MIFACLAEGINDPSSLTPSSVQPFNFSRSFITSKRGNLPWEEIKGWLKELNNEKNQPVSSVPQPLSLANPSLYQTCLDELEGILCDKVRDGKITKNDCDFLFGTPSTTEKKKAVSAYRAWVESVVRPAESFEKMKKAFANPAYKQIIVQGIWTKVECPLFWNEEENLLQPKFSPLLERDPASWISALEELENRAESGLSSVEDCSFSSPNPSVKELTAARTAYLNWVKKNLYPATSKEEMDKIIRTADIKFVQRGLWGEVKGILKPEPRLI